jgi:DNA polymerase (family 10)
MNNYEIADHFSLLSKLMDIHGDNPFKSKSYSIGAYHIEKLPQEISTMDDATLFGQKGIGASLGAKIREIQNTGKLDILEQIIASTPPGVLEMLNIKGLGPKKISVIWKDMGIETLGELEYACHENRLAAVKGFGAKTQAAVLESISFYNQSQGHHLWAEVEQLAHNLVQQLQKNNAEYTFLLTGDIRRQNETVEFVEIVSDIDEATISKQFESIPDCIINSEPNNTLTVQIPQQPKIKFHLSEQKYLYRTLFLTTGSAEFIEAFTRKHNLPEEPASEEEIFASNKLDYILPALRETEMILERAATHTIQNVITHKDIKGIIHSHSTWSDGLDTIEYMAKSAIKDGYEYLVISDHSQSAYYANGLTPERIAAQHAEIDKLNEKLAPFKIFKSIEADILGDGSLDYTNDVLSTFDLVIASIHSNLKMTLDKAMDRILAAVKNPYTTILGHPTGRLLLSREGYPVDHRKIIDTCAAYNVVIEINAHPKRLDIDWRWIEYAMEKGVLLSIDPDAHSANAYKDVYYGAMSAQKGGLIPKYNLSSYSLQEFEAYLASYKMKTQQIA